VKITPDRRINAAILFQRFLLVSRSGEPSLEEVLTFKLSPYLSALFETRDILWKGDKPDLAQAIRVYAKGLSSEAVKTELRTLLHRLPCNNVKFMLYQF
jgi:hypothetical protein